jgi:hypothetical protein
MVSSKQTTQTHGTEQAGTSDKASDLILIEGILIRHTK